MLTHGAPSCEFNWIGANFQTEQEFYDLMKLKSEISHYTMKDFLYHSGHALSALRRTFYVELSVPETERICSAALWEFAGIMGEAKCAALEEESHLDFLEI